MIRTLLLCLFIAGFGITAFAQDSVKTQTLNVSLSDVIQLTLAGSPEATLTFSGAQTLLDGVTSNEEEFIVRSNKSFDVSVRTDNALFQTLVSPDPQMRVDDVLKLKLTTNNTGGTIAPAFTDFSFLTSTPQLLITDGAKGEDKSFKVTYRAMPNFGFPQGSYKTNIIYTATQK